MGFFKRLYEAFFKKGNVSVNSNVLPSYGDLNVQDLYQLIQDIKAVAQDRKNRLAEYRSMLADGVTLSAVELMAEDATQPDPDTGYSVWISCPEFPQLEKEMNDFIHINFNSEINLYAIAFNLIVFGDAYVSTFYSDDAYKLAGNRVGDYFEIETAEFITHIFHYGKPAGFIANKNQNAARNQLEEQVILDEKDFIHFSADNGLNYARVSIEMQDNNTTTPTTQNYTVKYGNSFLEAARTLYKTLDLYKDLMMLARLTRSQFYRVFSIDVGNADDRETTRIVKEIRDVVSNSQTIQPKVGINTLSSPMSTGGNIYLTTRNGRNSVNIETVGGDFNVSEMADLDFFDNQYYAALKVPKQFLGQSEDLPSGLGESSLTRLDIRYARTIQRIQKYLGIGIRKLLIWKFQLDNFENVYNSNNIPKFSVCFRQVSSAEAIERAEYLEQQNNRITQLMDILTTVDEENKINKYQIIPFLVDNLALPEPLANMIKNNIQLAYPDSVNNVESNQLNDHLNHYVKEDESLNETPHHNHNIDRNPKKLQMKKNRNLVSNKNVEQKSGDNLGLDAMSKKVQNAGGLKQAIMRSKKNEIDKKNDDYFQYDR